MAKSSSEQVTTTNETASVVAYRHAAVPGMVVRTSPDNHKREDSGWSIAVYADGAVLPYFAGKSFKNQKSADRAIRKYLRERASRLSA